MEPAEHRRGRTASPRQAALARVQRRESPCGTDDGDPGADPARPRVGDRGRADGAARHAARRHTYGYADGPAAARSTTAGRWHSDRGRGGVRGGEADRGLSQDPPAPGADPPAGRAAIRRVGDQRGSVPAAGGRADRDLHQGAQPYRHHADGARRVQLGELWDRAAVRADRAAAACGAPTVQ